MKVLDIKENEDGSATIELDMSEEENRQLIEYAVINLLKEYIEIEKRKA